MAKTALVIGIGKPDGSEGNDGGSQDGLAVPASVDITPKDDYDEDIGMDVMCHIKGPVGKFVITEIDGQEVGGGKNDDNSVPTDAQPSKGMADTAMDMINGGN